MVRGWRVGLPALLASAVLVLAVGVSRVYLGYRYASAVLGGYCAGLHWVFASATAVEGGRAVRLSRRRTRGSPGPEVGGG